MSYSGNFYADLHAAQYEAAAQFDAVVESCHDEAAAKVWADKGLVAEVFSQQDDLLANVLMTLGKSKRTDADLIAFAKSVLHISEDYLRDYILEEAESMAWDAVDDDNARRATAKATGGAL